MQIVLVLAVVQVMVGYARQFVRPMSALPGPTFLMRLSSGLPQIPVTEQKEAELLLLLQRFPLVERLADFLCQIFEKAMSQQ
jgi:hypothetical protein